MADLARLPALPEQPVKLARVQASLLRVDGLGLVELRLAPGDAAALEIASGLTGFPLPAAPRRAAKKDGLAALCLAPDRWLLSGERGRVAPLAPALREALAGVAFEALDVSDAYATIRVDGADSTRLLLMASSTDLTREPLSEGRCRRIRLGLIDAVMRMHRVRRGTLFDLHVARSYARDAWTWLEMAGELTPPAPLFTKATPPPV